MAGSFAGCLPSPLSGGLREDLPDQGREAGVLTDRRQEENLDLRVEGARLGDLRRDVVGDVAAVLVLSVLASLIRPKGKGTRAPGGAA